MAKYEPRTTPSNIEARLAHALKDHEPIWPFPYFYTDMSPVYFDDPLGMSLRASAEADAFSGKTDQSNIEVNLEPGHRHQSGGSHDQITWTMAQELQTREYKYSIAVRIKDCDPFCVLLSMDEAQRLLAVGERPRVTKGSIPDVFARLPREVRDIIYDFTLPFHTLELPESIFHQRQTLPEAIGDPTGFFESTRGCASLQLCKGLRAEMLPIAYANMCCEAQDLGNAVKLLMAIGTIGRDSLGHLDVLWSGGGSEEEHEHSPSEATTTLWLPSRHVPLCLHLLAECRGLKTLSLRFERELLSATPLDDFQRNTGILQLASIKHVIQVNMLDVWGDSLDDHALLQWLKREMAAV